MNFRALKISSSLIIAIFGLASCSFLGPQNVPEVTTYTLALPKTQPHFTSAPKLTLMVSTPTAGPGYDSRKMIYTNKTYELSAFVKSQWAATPAEMLEPILIQKLRDTGYFHAVVSNAFSSSRQVFLRTHLLELRQDFTQNPSRVSLALQAEIINAEDSRVINSKTFSTSVLASENTPYSGVVAANRAVERLVSEIALFSLSSLNNAAYQSSLPPDVKYWKFHHKGKSEGFISNHKA